MKTLVRSLTCARFRFQCRRWRRNQWRNIRRVQQSINLLKVWSTQQAYEQIPGVSAAVVHDQQVVFGAEGSVLRILNRKLTAGARRTAYSICSISKLFTSIAVMQLRDAGKVCPMTLFRDTWFNITMRPTVGP